jgi:uncharacterized protein (TIGR03790 family)
MRALTPVLMPWVMCLLIGTTRAHAQSAENVLVVVNSTSAASETIGRHYVERRGVPQDNVCAIHTSTDESIERTVYYLEIEEPIWKCISAARAQDRILYIVLTKDVPIRIRGTGGRTGTGSSVDSELTLLYRRRTDQAAPVAGYVPNPYFADATPIAAIKPFTHESYDIYLVTRLDGYTIEDALALVDRADKATARVPEADGRFVLDERASWVDSGGNAWLRAAAARLRTLVVGDRVVLDESARVLTNEAHVLGYYSWGSNDPAIRIRHFEMDFVPGALAGMFVSTDARTFKEPPPGWTPSDTVKPGSVFGGSAQSLAGDLIREGVTGVAGHVDEPYLDATIRPDILFPAYVTGRNLAESYYAAMPYLSWQTIVIGDPLCAPFPHTALTTRALDSGLDTATELPTYFARRRLSHMSPMVNRDAAAAYVRAEARTARRDTAGARQALEAAVAADAHFTEARLALATADDRDDQFDRAISQYRAIVSYSPNDVVALNNLAYDLAVHRNEPQEALPIAERACGIAKDNPVLLDTLGWIQHLLKHNTEAAATMRHALSGGFANVEMVWHAAAIYAANNDLTRAASALKVALKANPGLADLDEIKTLQQQLSAAGK